MTTVIFKDNEIIYDKDNFYQYDYGQKIEFHGLSLPDTVQIHFAKKGSTAESEIGNTVNNITTVNVPDSVLKNAGEFTIYIYITTETSGKTLRTVTFNVKEREKPKDYPEELQLATTSTSNEELLQRIATLENEVNMLKASNTV